jgi:hypothetical protein
MEVVDEIAAVRTGNRAGHSDVPTEDVLIRKVRRWVHVDRSWLTWNAGTVLKVARAISESGSCEDLPILADALAEAGCQSEEILAHCRARRPSSRASWVVDLLLEKE